MWDSPHWDWGKGYCTKHRGQSVPCRVCIDQKDADLFRPEPTAQESTDNYWQQSAKAAEAMKNAYGYQAKAPGPDLEVKTTTVFFEPVPPVRETCPNCKMQRPVIQSPDRDNLLCAVCHSVVALGSKFKRNSEEAKKLLRECAKNLSFSNYYRGPDNSFFGDLVQRIMREPLPAVGVGFPIQDKGMLPVVAFPEKRSFRIGRLPVMIAVENIVNERPPARDFDQVWFDALVASISQVGIKTPLEVMEKNIHKYSVLDGWLRHRAAIQLGIWEVPCIITERW